MIIMMKRMGECLCCRPQPILLIMIIIIKNAFLPFRLQKM